MKAVVANFSLGREAWDRLKARFLRRDAGTRPSVSAAHGTARTGESGPRMGQGAVDHVGNLGPG